MTEQQETEKTVQAPQKNAAPPRPEARAAEQRSARDRDKATLGRVRRKLLRLMLTSALVTFIALAVVAAAIIYKITHRSIAPQTAALPVAAATEAAAAKADAVQAPYTEQEIPLAAGEKAEVVGFSGNVLLLRLSEKNNDTTGFIVYDFVGQRLIARIKTVNQN